MLEWDLLIWGRRAGRFLIVVDWIRVSFTMAVLFISGRVYLFRGYYIEGENFFNRFHIILRVFVSRIVLLILSPNFFSLLLGWDGLGLSSFLLVIYYRRKKSYGAGFLTALRNRVGDALILISLPFLLSEARLSLGVLRLRVWSLELLWGLVVITALITKRAQIPFRAWLPAAMAAPTPVSALVHSSTLVTAGIYILIRLSSLNSVWQSGSAMLAVLGRLTIVIARLRAFFETDIKKIVALSTLRQLGVIVVGVGLGIRELSFFHLLAHAFFKALLFIASGCLIHNSRNYQDLRFMGNKALALPLSSTMVVVSSCSLCGLPFISAFYSKELILERIIILSNPFLVYEMFFLGVGITFFYRLRFVYFRVLTYSNQSSLIGLSEGNKWLTRSYCLIFRAALLGGRGIRWGFIINYQVFIFNYSVKLSPLIIIGLILSFFIIRLQVGNLNLKYFWYTGNLWSLSQISSRLLIKLGQQAGSNMRLRDQLWVNFFLKLIRPSKFGVRGGVSPEEYFLFLRLLLSFALLGFLI